MKFDNNIPIYLQIMDDIKGKIINGTLKEEEKIPSIRNYCLEYKVTSLTIQRTLSELEREGVLYTKKGIGSFVVKGIIDKLKNQTSKKLIKTFTTNMKNIGFTDQEILKIIKEELKNE